MARVFLDSREVAIPSDSPVLCRILQHVEATCLPHGSAVKEIRVNGIAPVPASRSGARSLCRINRHARVDLVTGDARDAARESVRDALSFLDRALAVSPSLIESFEESPGQGSFEKLEQLWEGLYWLDILLEKLKKDFPMAAEGVLIQGKPAYEHHGRYVEMVRQLAEAQRKSDFTVIPGLLRNEILPLLPVWREWFDILLRKAAGGRFVKGPSEGGPERQISDVCVPAGGPCVCAETQKP